MVILLLLRSPAISPGLTFLGEIYVYVTIFNPTIESDTFCLCGCAVVIMSTVILLQMVLSLSCGDDANNDCVTDCPMCAQWPDTKQLWWMWPSAAHWVMWPLLVTTVSGMCVFCQLLLSVGKQTNYRLIGLVVKSSTLRAEDPGFESRLRQDFFGVESYQ